METGLGKGVAVDENHLNLVTSLIQCHKPSNILELGVGSGATTLAIKKGIELNTNEETLSNYISPTITLVDNWHDWGFKPPACVEELKTKVKLVESDELDFLFKKNKETYDFIFSDADHWNTDKWFDFVYDRVLRNGGILIYHDVSTQNPLPDNDLPGAVREYR